MANVYLVVLEGQGDLNIKVVDEETFNWITSADQGRPDDDDSGSWLDRLVPASQIEKMKKRDGNNYEPVWITRGSWDNDRAIFAVEADGYDQYDRIKDAIRAIKKNKDKLADEYHGCIY